VPISIQTLNYAFLVLHAHVALWKERGLITTTGSPVKHSQAILDLLEAALLPKQVTVIHCPGHQPSGNEITKGNNRANMAAKEAVQKPYVQAPLLWEQSLLSYDCPLFLPTELQQASEQGYHLDHRGG
jgi:ribonuclease HI